MFVRMYIDAALIVALVALIHMANTIIELHYYDISMSILNSSGALEASEMSLVTMFIILIKEKLLECPNA